MESRPGPRTTLAKELATLEQRIVRDLELASATLHALAVVVADPSLPTPAYIESDAARLRDGVRISRERLVVMAARQAPVAGDLRLVLVLFHITRHQWQVANQFRLLTEQLMEIDPDEVNDPGIGERLARMARAASVMLSRAGAALAARDVADARALAVEDDVIDTLNREVFARALAISRPVGRREVAMHQMLLARSLERVADNAVDIGEQVEFLVTGELREFSDASKPRRPASYAPSPRRGPSPALVSGECRRRGARPVGTRRLADSALPTVLDARSCRLYAGSYWYRHSGFTHVNWKGESLMKRLRALAALSAVGVSLAVGAGISTGTASALQPNPLGIGLKPVLGWSSWSALRRAPTATQVEAEANAMVSSGLKAAGYMFIDLDDFYYQCPGSQGPNVDQWGRWVTDPTIFPPGPSGQDGIAVLAAYVHSLGLKFGIYLTPGISKQAVAQNTPIEATGPGGVELSTASGYTANQIATTTSAENYNCGGMVRLDWTNNPAGAQAYYDSIADRFASWGVDLIKFDGQEDYSGPDLDGFAAAIAQSSNPRMLLDATEGDYTIALEPSVVKDATQWEYSPDIESGGGAAAYTNYANVSVRFNNVVLWQPYVGPGSWQDLDSVEIGNGSSPGVGGREDGLTVDGRKTMLALWSLAGSPLILGPDLTNLDPVDQALLTNPDVLAVDQDGVSANRIAGGNYTSQTKYQVFAKMESGGDGDVGLFNTTDGGPETLSTTASAVGLPASPAYLLTDLWSHTSTETTGAIAASVPAQGAGLYRVSTLSDPTQAPPSTVVGLSGLSGTFQPSQTQMATESFTDNGALPATGVQLSLSAPAGWTVTPTATTSFASVASGQTVTATFNVAAQSTTTATAGLTGTATYNWQGNTPQTDTVSQPERVAFPIKVNEVRTGVTGATTNQFIELYNAGTSPVDISGWTVVYRSSTAITNTTAATIPGVAGSGTTVLAGGGYYLLGRSGGYTGSPAANLTFTTSLSSSGGAVGVLDPTGAVADSVGYGSANNALVENCAAPAPGTNASPGTSIVRTPNGFDTDNNCTDFLVTSLPTPGAANINAVSSTTSPGGSVSSTLAISVSGVQPSFGAFVPGLAQTYTTTTGATVTSTAASATLIATDSSSSFPGYLVNSTASGGPYALAKGLQVAAGDPGNTSGSGVFGDLSVMNPATLLTYGAPVSNDPVTLSFQQPIGATDPAANRQLHEDHHVHSCRPRLRR